MNIEHTLIITDYSNICSSFNCNKLAKLSCPSCLKLLLDPCKFCSQECFKFNWNTHKKYHKIFKQSNTDNIPLEFIGYHFSGNLRPFLLSVKRIVPIEIMRPDYADHPIGFSISEDEDKKKGWPMKIYNLEEIDGIKKACRIGREVLDIGGFAICVGITCDEIDKIIHDEIIKRGAYPSPLNYNQFPKSVCTSVNEVICHGIPDYRPLQNGDIINIDVSVYYNGYHGDLNETFTVGVVDEQSIKLIECAFKCLQVAVAIVKPGTLYRDIGNIISKVASAANCSIVTSYCGHGIGQLFHTSPVIPHYPDNKAKGKMEIGHIFTIEPMINLGKSRDTLWPDKWTVVTVDGSRSAQFEHTILVTSTGCEILTARNKEPSNILIWNENIFQR
jgi:methionyl aminopeptidase